jgi:hypothetical protein
MKSRLFRDGNEINSKEGRPLLWLYKRSPVNDGHRFYVSTIIFSDALYMVSLVTNSFTKRYFGSYIVLESRENNEE